MIIKQGQFSFYGLLIIISLVLGIIYIYKNQTNKKNMYLFFILYISSTVVFGKYFTMISSHNNDFINAGLSSLGGVFGTILSAYIFEKIDNHKNEILKYTILSLPLIYSISKIGCFIAGCCFGMPYEGIGYVIYPEGLNIPVFPIQIVETILFLVLFLIMNIFRNKKNIIYYTVISCSILKFLLDFLRYEHLTKIITINQIVCIIIIIITSCLLIYNKKKDRR